MRIFIFGIILSCFLLSFRATITPIYSTETLQAYNDLDTIYQQKSIRIPILDNDKIDGKLARIIVTPGRFGRAMLNLDNTVTYRPNKEICGETDSFDYLICNETECDTATVFVYLLCEKLTVVTGFSPNAEFGKNTFTIMGLDQYPDHSLSIFSKAGNRVFHTKNYRNDWNGTFKNEPLELGTYLYVLKTATKETFQGYVKIED